MMAALQSTALSFDGDESTQTKLYGAQLEYTRHHLLLSLAFISKTFVNISDKNLKLCVLTLRITQTVITSVCVRSLVVEKQETGRVTG